MQSGIISSADTFSANRAVGTVKFDVHLKDGATRRRELHESGSLRVRFPSPEQKGLSAVFVNTAGGVAGVVNFDPVRKGAFVIHRAAVLRHHFLSCVVPSFLK